MNPEPKQVQTADVGSDWFVLGVPLSNLLTGHLPCGEIKPFHSGRYRPRD